MESGEVESLVRELSDREAIRDLAHRYAHCVWRKQFAAAVDLFTDDGEMDMGDRPVIRGRKALLESYEQMLGAADFHPFVHSHLISLQGERATGTCHLDLRATIDGESMIGSGYYEDECVRVDGEWKFRRRKLTMCYLVPLREGWAQRSPKPAR
jgi:ketosteroid isomerase-like protein